MTTTYHAICEIGLGQDGTLELILDGAQGGERRIKLADEAIAETLRRVLQAREAGLRGIGTEGAPTAAQLRHLQLHREKPDPRCVFCDLDGRFDNTPPVQYLPTKSRVLRVVQSSGLSADDLGL